MSTDQELRKSKLEFEIRNKKYHEDLLNARQRNESLQGVINESIDLKDILEVEVSSLRDILA